MKEEKICKDLTFTDCELAILRMAVDKAGEKMGKRMVESDAVKKIIQIVEDFIKKKGLICYGGTAINNILPKYEQFYNKDIEIPDYDFFSVNAMNDAIELADTYYKHGFQDVEAKAGSHHGTFKVYVNFIPVADITFIPKEIFNAMKKDAIQVSGIKYAGPNFLRMGMYLELSRPVGDTSRWEKVLKRLILLNKHYPLASGVNCNKIQFQREMTGNKETSLSHKIFNIVRDTFINQGVVFFGGYAASLYSNYMPRNQQKKLKEIADFDVLSNDPKTTADIVKERLKDQGITDVKLIERNSVGEIVPKHYEILVNKDTVAFIYEPVGCHSYNVLFLNKKKIKVATIDTMLSFYLAFLYTDRKYYNYFYDRIVCMAKFLFDVQEKNRLSQKGLLKRFSITCYGHQQTLEDIRANKSKKHEELSKDKGSKEYKEWFLNYKPDSNSKKKEVEKQNPKSIKSLKTVKPTKKTKNTNKKTRKTRKTSQTKHKNTTTQNKKWMKLIYGNKHK